MEGLLERRLSRRRFLKGAAALLGIAATPLPTAWLQAALPPQSPRAAGRSGSLATLRHLAWVWNFSDDGSPADIRPALAAHGLGIALKTHDGTDWMASYDSSPQAVSGPGQVETLAEYFEEAGVPFHAWCVVQGRDPKREAQMCADVLSAGARSITIDLEPHTGFWVGSPAEASTFGRELRRRQPNAWVSVSFDPRPWVAQKVPLQQFAAFCDEFAPQVYWESMGTPPNLARFSEEGWWPGPAGVTPEFLLDVSLEMLYPYRFPMQPIGQGSAALGAWKSFVDVAYRRGAGAVSMWRFGVANPQVLQLLQEASPRPPVHVVRPGETLSALAEEWRTTVDAIAEANGIANPDFIWVGQKLNVPGRVGERRYVIQPGDTLTGLAWRWGTTVSAIAEANNLWNLNYIYVGDELRMP